MSEFAQLSNKYSIKYFNKVKKICEPLCVHFNINHFWYTRTTESGRFFHITSNPDIANFYYGLNFHRTSPFYRHPKLIPPGYYSYKSIQDPKFQDGCKSLFLKSPLEYGNFVTKKQHELLVFGYAMKESPKRSLDDVIANNLPILKKFNDYFAQELTTFVKQEDLEFINLASELGENYTLPLKGINTRLNSKEKCSFLESLKLISLDEVEKLSPRELECLKYLQHGLTYPEIANELAISKRTVEKYFESVKDKLRCNSKLELFEKANLLNLSDYF
jgi:DNA-binding NarL/FixJ family response regulator